MKIIGQMVCGPNEKYLEGSLLEFKRLCDDAVIVTNNADEKTKETIKKFGFWQYEDNREWGKDQPNIKTDLLKRVSRLHPDWIIGLDADERFPPSFHRRAAEALAESGEVAWKFLVVNLYNDPDHFAHDVGIQRFWNVRFFKFIPKLGLEYQATPVHCGIAPPYAYRFAWNAPYYLEHYGLMLKEDRDRKAERYRKYDPKARFKGREYYDDLERDLRMIPFDRYRLLEQLKNECKPRKIPKLHE